MKKFPVIFFLFILFLVSLNAEAVLIDKNSVDNSRNINCPLYDNLKDKLSLDIFSIKREIKPGELINFNGTLSNKNNFPLGDVGIYVKIFKDDQYYTQNNITIDQFYVLNDKTVLTDGTLNYKFNWKATEGLSIGSYKAVVFLSQNNEIINEVSNSYDFRIRSTEESDIFSISSIIVNNKPYQDSIILEESQSAKIEFIVENNTELDQEVFIETRVFNGEYEDFYNLIKSEGEYLMLKPNESKIIKINEDSNYKKVYLKTTVTIGASSKILNLNYKRVGYQDDVIKSLGLSSFPLNIDRNDILICTNKGLSEEEKISLFLIGEDGQLIYSNSYSTLENNIVENIKDKYDDKSFKLIATVEKGGEVLEYKELKYECEDGCLNDIYSMNIDRTMDTSSRTIIILITILLMIITTMYFVSHKKETRPNEKEDDK